MTSDVKKYYKDFVVDEETEKCLSLVKNDDLSPVRTLSFEVDVLNSFTKFY